MCTVCLSTPLNASDNGGRTRKADYYATAAQVVLNW